MQKNWILSGIAATGLLFVSCQMGRSAPEGPQKITILQTADIHGQVYPHSELFWENEKIHHHL